MEIELSELKNLLLYAAEMGATQAITKLGLAKPYLSKNMLYKIHGRGTVDRWVTERLITPIKDGTTTSNFRFNRVEVDAVAKASNRISYETVQERI